jgi:hypothetical protein
VSLTSKRRRFDASDIPVACGLVGVGLLSWGAHQAYPPAGLIVAGLCLLAFYVARELYPRKERKG